VSEQTSNETPIGFEDLDKRVSHTEKQVEAVGVSLRETAKWIISGIAVAAAGVIAGTSLSSLGAFGIEWRLLAAFSAASIGFIGLGYLFASALKVIIPPHLTLEDAIDGKTISAQWKQEIEIRMRPLLAPFSGTLKGFCDHLRASTNLDGSPLSPDETRSLSTYRRLLGSTVSLELQRLLFRRLTLKTFIVTPIIALTFLLFAWAANPAKEDLRVPALEKAVDVQPNDIARLGRVLGNPLCVGARLDVIVFGEWRSGVQEIVTVPKPSCPPTRLRLDHGRFSQVN
jgi:hypothetical protein